MLPSSKHRFKTEALLSIWLFCLGIALLVAPSWVHETISPAAKTNAQAVKLQSESTTALAPRDEDARQAFGRAEQLCANWNASSFREAIDHYEKAALLWTSVPDFQRAAEATLRAGDLYFYLSEFAQALKTFQNAEALAQKSGDWLGQATALSQMGHVQSYLGHMDLAQKRLSQAFDLFERHKSNRTGAAAKAYGEALTNLAELSYSTGDFSTAWKQLDNALNAFQDNRDGEARVRLFKGYIAGTRGEINKALEEISRALELYREVNNKRGEALALTALGMWHSSNSHDDVQAIEMHKAALETLHTIGDRYSEAIALNSIGQAHDYLKLYSEALSYYKNALTLYEDVGMPYAVSGTTCNIALAEFNSGKLDQALESYKRCLQLSHDLGNRRFEAFASEGIAKIDGAQGRHESALKQYQNAERFFESINDHRGQAMALNGHGGLLLQLGEKQKALEVFGQAFSLSEKMGDKEILTASLYNLARANEALGLHENAHSLVKKSFNLIEEIRANVASPNYRASYFSEVRKHYDLCIEILMELHKERPTEGFAAEAFLVNEQGRARLLIDLLSESRSEIRAGAATDLVEKERNLRALIRAQAQYQLNLSLSGRNPAELTEVTDQIARLKSDYEGVQAQLRKQNPRLFSYEQFAPASLERIQKELRGSDDTMLLEYTLGDEHSYLWAITSDTSDTFLLPARKEIEDAANDFYQTITARQRRDGQSDQDYKANIETASKVYPEQASNLSRMLLGPVAEKLGRHRLIIVTDGALQYIPFDALPVRTTDPAESVLVANHEVVRLPSASTLIAIRGPGSNKNSSGKIAIIADPVFSSSDERVQTAASSSEKVASLQNLGQNEQQTIKNLKLARLSHASEEADAITAVAPWGSTLVAKGFDASRETAMSPEVSQAQIVHFATHGFLDDKHPELSGIVLTMMDRDGAQTKGVMPLADIYSLDLSAQLTVLSACETALGQETKGEGLVGLTHSFMSAGAKSVVASLWKVDDRATAALMSRFYEGVLQQGMTPAAALRAAKLRMMTETQWREPFYWAGFVLQGEYTNHIAVDGGYSKLQIGLGALFSLILIAVALLIFQKRRQRIPPAQFT